MQESVSAYISLSPAYLSFFVKGSFLSSQFPAFRRNCQSSPFLNNLNLVQEPRPKNGSDLWNIFIYILSFELKHFILYYLRIPIVWRHYWMAICIQVTLQQIIFIFEIEAIFVYCRFYVNLLNILIIIQWTRICHISVPVLTKNICRPFNNDK